MPVCQVRIVREVGPTRHEQYGDVLQDRLLDRTGEFWCAVREAQSASQIATLRVVRTRIATPNAEHVFDWLARGVAVDAATPSASDSAVERVLVRAGGEDWAPLAERMAGTVRQRWNRIAASLPEACGSTR
jgi:hypothetical protein